MKYVDGVTYAHKGNVEKHIRSGSLHQWAKDKFSKMESDTQSQPKPLNQTTLTRCVTESVKKNYTRLFNTAFSLVMAEKSFADFPFAIKMQKRNGLEFLPGKDDEHSCSIFVHFLAEALRSDIKSILLLSNFFAGEMDGSEARKTKDEKELVYCKVVIRGQPVELFLKCQKMADFGGVDAACTKQAFDGAFLQDYGVSDERYQNLLIAVCADGAGVNMGRISGACTEMKSSRPWLLVIHCVNHRLELAIGDAFLSDVSFKSLDEMMTSIYYLFRNSGKNKRLIIRLAQRLSVTWVSFVNPKGTRFQAHRYHGIRVMIVNYLSLLLFAENMIEANNKTCKPELKAQLRGYLNKWLTYGYLGALELYRRVLRLTSHLSLIMQGQDILITDVLDGLEECKQELSQLAASKEPLFPFSTQVDDSADHATLTVTATNLPATTQFKERVKLTERQKKGADKNITKVRETFELKKVTEGKQKVQKIKTDLIPAIASCLDKRYQSLQEPVIQAIRIADHSTWQLEDPIWGKAWVRTLAEHFSVPLSQHNFSLDLALKELNGLKALKATKFKGYKGRMSFWEKIFESFYDKFPHFLLIIELCLCVILSSSTVERGFSTVKRHLCDSRLSLANDSLDDLLCVRINAPLLQKLDPSYEIKLVNKAVELYMNSSTLKRGRYRNTVTRYSEVEPEVASLQQKSSDLFLPISSAVSIPEPENELLGDVKFVGNISSSDSESQDESDSDSQSEVEEESEGFTL